VIDMTVRRYFGACEEANFNPDTPPEAKFHVEIASATLDVPDNPNIEFESGLYRGRTSLRPGFYSPSGNIVFPINIRALGYILKWALGSYVFTDGGGGTNTHEIYGQEATLLPSFTARIGKDDLGEHVFAGTVINSLELVIENDYILCTIDCVSAKDTKTTIKAIADLSLFDENLLTFIAAGITFGGNIYNCKVKNITITVENNADAPAGKGIGTRYPCRIPVGARNVNLSGTLYFEDDTEYQKYWGQAGGIGDNGPTNEEIVITIDSGDDGSIELKFPKVMYTNVQAQPSGRAPIDHDFSAYAMVNGVTLADEVTEINTELLATIESNNTDMDNDIES
jgi:hypothetical protein